MDLMRYLSIGRVWELLEHETIRCGFQKIISLFDSSSHAFSGISDNQLSSKCSHCNSPLQACIRRHGQNHFVAFQSSHKGHTDAHISRRWLDQCRLHRKTEFQKFRKGNFVENVAKSCNLRVDETDLSRSNQTFLFGIGDHRESRSDDERKLIRL